LKSLTELSQGNESFLEALALVARGPAPVDAVGPRSAHGDPDVAPEPPVSHCRPLDCVNRADLAQARIPPGRAINSFCDLAAVFH
jgi:hypothetical protein